MAKQAQGKAGKVVKAVKAWGYLLYDSLEPAATQMRIPISSPFVKSIPVLIVPDDGSYTVTPKRAGRKGK